MLSIVAVLNRFHPASDIVVGWKLLDTTRTKLALEQGALALSSAQVSPVDHTHFISRFSEHSLVISCTVSVLHIFW